MIANQKTIDELARKTKRQLSAGTIDRVKASEIYKKLKGASTQSQSDTSSPIKPESSKQAPASKPGGNWYDVDYNKVDTQLGKQPNNINYGQNKQQNDTVGKLAQKTLDQYKAGTIDKDTALQAQQKLKAGQQAVQTQQTQGNTQQNTQGGNWYDVDYSKVDEQLGIPQTMDMAIQTGEVDKSTPDGIDISRRMNILNAMNTMSPEELGAMMDSGKLKPSSQSMNDLMRYNPELYQATMEQYQERKDLKYINNYGKTIYNGMDGKYKSDGEVVEPYDPVKSANSAIMDSLVAKFGDNAQDYFEMTQQIMNNPEIQAQKKVVSDLALQRQKINEDIFNVREQAGVDLGSEAPEYLRNAYISQKTKQLQRQLRTIDLDLSAQESLLGTYIEEGTQMLDAFEKGMQMDMAEAEAQAKAESQYKSDLAKQQTAQDKLDREREKFDRTQSLKEQDQQFDQGYKLSEQDRKMQDTRFDQNFKTAKEAGYSIKNTRAVRNNNPGNLRDKGFGNPSGYDSGNFAIFDSPEAGLDALKDKLNYAKSGKSKVYSPDMTLQQFFSKYAPSGDNNNPTAYANAVAKHLGVDSGTTKLSQIDTDKLAQEITRHEDGNMYKVLYGNGGGDDGTGGSNKDGSITGGEKYGLSPDQLKRVASGNWTDKKQLYKIQSLDGYSNTDKAHAITDLYFTENLNHDSSIEDISKAVDKMDDTFGKDLSYTQTLKKLATSAGPENAIKYDIYDNDSIVKGADIDTMVDELARLLKQVPFNDEEKIRKILQDKGIGGEARFRQKDNKIVERALAKNLEF